ncbi:MAG: hypothetical protein Q7K16_02180, partial [Candidatus Azambacteria bacterium]|nr:hypothetical protein [Candidatus Azambacteria bacterium]
VVEAGGAAQTLYDSNGAAKAAMDHPVAAGVVVGAGGGMAAYGAAAGATYLSATYLGGAGTACVAFCGKAGQAERTTEKVAELLNGPIKITSDRLQHVFDGHTPEGIESAGNSIFNKGENIVSLIQQGTQQGIEKQAYGNNFQRVFDVGRNIGIDRVTNQQTSIMTVITNKADKLITAFPGRP